MDRADRNAVKQVAAVVVTASTSLVMLGAALGLAWRVFVVVGGV